MGNQKSSRAYTFAELIVLLVIVVLLAGIVIPGYHRASLAVRMDLVCQTNLRNYGQAMNLYLTDHRGRFPRPSNFMTGADEEFDDSAYSSHRWCRWHMPQYQAEGPLATYILNENTYLCPVFDKFARSLGQNHAYHDSDIEVVPYLSYSMNGFLGRGTLDYYPGVYSINEVTRSHAEVFVFSEENAWPRGGDASTINDGAIMANGREWLGTFHSTMIDTPNNGAVNTVFIDGHVQKVRSAFSVGDQGPADSNEMEFGKFEKYAWPHREPPPSWDP